MQGKFKTIAFVKMGSFSHTNDSVLAILNNEFPNHPILVVDIFRDVVNYKSPKNIFFALIENGIKILRSKHVFAKGLVRNTNLFKNVKNEIQEHLKNRDLLFTIQTQSLFDTSIDGVPNFIYTDHTSLANNKYPEQIKKNELLNNKKWIDCEKLIYQNAVMNFTMSSNIRDSIIYDYGCRPEKVRCVYAGSNIDINPYGSILNKKTYSKNILFVGLDWERKVGPTLVKAFRNVLQKHPDASLTIVGCSPELDLENCTVAGRVPLKEVQTYYAKADIFCLPT